MSTQLFNPNFVGYWRESNKNELPKSSGIFCVFDCFYDPTNKRVYLRSLIYIGESNDVNQAVKNHEKRKHWAEYVWWGNELCYSFCPVEAEDRERVKAALIYIHKPPVNVAYRNSFPFEKTYVKSTGQTILLSEFFVASQKA